MRQDVEFQAEGPRLRGWLYTPRYRRRAVSDDRHGSRLFSRQGDVSRPLRRVFSEAGLAALVFDNRNFGASVLTPADLALEAYNRALQPKRLEVLPTGHFDAYVGEGFQRASGAAREWFAQHLQQAGVRAPAMATA